MDHFVRTVWTIALFGGTGAVIVIVLPQIVVYALEVVEHVQAARAQRRLLESDSPRAETPPLDSVGVVSEH